MKLIKPFVELSCELTGELSLSSGSIALASCFPSSTPHWSKELISHIMPWVNILCSYIAEIKTSNGNKLN